MNLHIGQKVLCVDGRFTYPGIREWFDTLPQEGGVYTVARVFQAHQNGSGPIGPAVELYEVPCLNGGPGPNNAGFSAERFRSLEEETTAEELQAFKLIFMAPRHTVAISTSTPLKELTR